MFLGQRSVALLNEVVSHSGYQIHRELKRELAAAPCVARINPNVAEPPKPNS